MSNRLFSASIVMLGFTTMVVAGPSLQSPSTAFDRSPSTTGSTRTASPVMKVVLTDASPPAVTLATPNVARPTSAAGRPDSVAPSTRSRFAKNAEVTDAGVVPPEEAPFRERSVEPVAPLKTVPYKSMSASKAKLERENKSEAPVGEPDSAELPPPAPKASTRPNVDEIDEPPPPSRRKVSDYRSAKYSGGQGATWKTGRDSHGFSGTYGGCRYMGFAGPGGFKLNRSC